MSRIFPQSHSLESQPGPGLQLWLRRLIVLGVLAVSLALPFLRSQNLAFLLAAAIAGMVAVYVFMRWPSLGVVLVVFVTMLVPLPDQIVSRLGGSLNTTILYMMFLLGLWFFDMFVRQREFKLAPARANAPLLVLLLVVFISFINGRINYYGFTQLASISAQIGGIAIFILSIGAFWLAANRLSGIDWLQRLTWLFVFLGGIYIAIRLTPQTDTLFRGIFQYGSDASIFWIWIVAMTASQALVNKKLSPRLRWGLFGLLAAIFYVSLSQAYDWKSGWLPAGIGLVMIFWVVAGRFRVPVMLVGVLIVLFGFSTLGNLVSGQENVSLPSRQEAWKVVLEISKANPVIGLGPANYYWYTTILTFMGNRVNLSSHNNFIDIYAQLGLVGLFSFLWFAWEVWWLGWRLQLTEPDGFSRAYAVGALGGLVGTLVSGMLGDWFLPYVYNVGLIGFRSSVFAWLFLGGLVLIDRVSSTREKV